MFQNRLDVVLQQPDEKEGDDGVEKGEGPVGSDEGLDGQDEKDDGENEAHKAPTNKIAKIAQEISRKDPIFSRSLTVEGQTSKGVRHLLQIPIG